MKLAPSGAFFIAKSRTSKDAADAHTMEVVRELSGGKQPDSISQSNAVTEPVTQPFTKEKLSVTDIDKMLRNKTAFTEEQIGNMYGLQLETVLENFVSQIKGNTKVNTDFRARVRDAIAQGDTDAMKTLVFENQEKFLMREDLTNELITSETRNADVDSDEDVADELQNMQEDATLQTGSEDGIYFEDEKWTGKTKLDYQPSSGAKLVATPGKTTTILGSFVQDMESILVELGIKKSKNFGAKVDGFNLLNVPDSDYKTYASVFWEKFNKIWLDEAVKRGDVLFLASKPTYNNLYRKNSQTGKMELTGFGKEYTYLKERGYSYDMESKRMIIGR